MLIQYQLSQVWPQRTHQSDGKRQNYREKKRSPVRANKPEYTGEYTNIESIASNGAHLPDGFKASGYLMVVKNNPSAGAEGPAADLFRAWRIRSIS